MSNSESDKPQNATTPPKPFINWVGGKRKIADKLIEYIPSGLNNYYEPFLEGGALFFAIKDKFKKYFLSDINLDLITSYNTVKKYPEELTNLYFSHYKNHSKQYFEKLRNINNSNDPTAITAKFIYLNRYSFKGIYRLNRKGQITSSFSLKNPDNSNLKERLKQCSSFLNDAFIYAVDFSFIEPQENDFVYFDPPYHKAGERFYTSMPFTEQDQIRLRDFATELNSKNVKFMISNSDTPFIRNIYSDFNIHSIEIKYLITCQSKISKEVVITNY
ncbi:MAG TPA: Dam family site-specific DNA-(adenine-N6)-methyltransferase [Rickettsia endosymbiont of Pyrocoelia pectoralis]|nr:Dam family site-specific DNA-(adenine-N6)-methyltransferase [Rickettsia endosymbiont of Pyrocoelia pectoralis]